MENSNESSFTKWFATQGRLYLYSFMRSCKCAKSKNIETEIFYIGTDAISPCRDCRACAKLGKCVIRDKVNEFLDKAETSDGFIFGSPVHYASASGIIVPFLDRAFMQIL